MRKVQSFLAIKALNDSTVSPFTMLSLEIFQSCVVLTKKEFLNCSVLAGNCLKHRLLLQTDLSTMFFLTKSSNLFARMVRFGF